MRAGAYENIIKILKHSVIQTASGQQKESWEVIKQTRANVRQTSGNRTDQNNEVFYEYMKTFIVHKFVEVDEFDRIEYNGKQYRILSIDEDRHLNQKTIMTELVNE